ncbi:F plasmid transfer operon protein TraF [Tumebacillus sp. BK434]|uniref:TlpA family protein disulfide reductase n=1 Tax=Tumebacillus sp. BK434 TaxID=2512169 RepID=UPI00104C234F|nr:conjugal transfer protein TraF [Tumebacillus sp. BK434]TCP52789.1 F plasmid transfer operon protein TraF [Tumebacillus sp. BK434]
MEQTWTLSQVGLWCFALVQFILYGVFLRMIGQFLKRVRLQPVTVRRAALAPGETAPPIRASDQQGRKVELAAGQLTLCLFVLHTCEICHSILPRLSDIGAQYPEMKIIVIASEDGVGEDAGLPERVSFVRSNEIRKEYLITYVPAMVMVSGAGRVLGAARVMSADDFEKRLELYKM